MKLSEKFDHYPVGMDESHHFNKSEEKWIDTIISKYIIKSMNYIEDLNKESRTITGRNM